MQPQLLNALTKGVIPIQQIWPRTLYIAQLYVNADDELLQSTGSSRRGYSANIR
jgi:hypothetical protein